MKKPLILLYAIILGLCLVRCSDDTDESNRQNYWSYCNPELSPSCSGPVFRAAVNGITPENCYVWAAMLDHDQLVAYGPSRWVRAGSFDALPVSIEFAGLNLMADYEYDIMYYQTVDSNLVGQPAGRVAAGGPHKLSFTQAEVDLIASNPSNREVEKVKGSRDLDTECFMTGGLAILKLVEDEFGAWYIDILPCSTAVDSTDDDLHWEVRAPAGTNPLPAIIDSKWGKLLPLHYHKNEGWNNCSLMVRDTQVPGRRDTVLFEIEYPSELGYRLGTEYNEWDALICEFADSAGFPPQLFKAQIRQESALESNSYRYEPKYDYDYISGEGQTPYKLTQTPYSWYRLASPAENGHDAHPQGTLLNWDDRWRGEQYYDCEDDWDSNGFVSAREFLDSCPFENWPSIPGTIDFTAQTAVSSSYGLVQLMWPTTLIVPIRWNSGSGGDPGDLMDGERSLRFSSRISRYHFTQLGWPAFYPDYRAIADSVLRRYNGNVEYIGHVRGWINDFPITE